MDSNKSVLLALSGGGYRAMLYHVGALWKLNEVGELSNLEHVSSVSGGSIAAGVLAAAWNKLEFVDGSATNFKKLVADPILRLATRTIDVPAVLTGLIPFLSAARVLEYFYQKYLFGAMHLAELPARPIFTFNATNMQTGAVWTFDRELMGDSSVGKRKSGMFPLAKAIAASSAFPPFLSPVILREKNVEWSHPTKTTMRSYDHLATQAAELSSECLSKYRERIVLVDGGVADNLGSVSTWDGSGDMYIGDGGTGSQPELRPGRNWFSQLRRVVSLIHEQPSQLRANRAKAEMADRDEGSSKSRSPRQSGDGAVWNMQYPLETHVETKFPKPNDQVGQGLATLPTRLCAMPADLQHRLVNWGYITCNRSLPYVNRLFLVGPYASAFQEHLPFPDAVL